MTRLHPEHPLIKVELDALGRPTMVHWAGRRDEVEMCNHWRIEEAWWRRPLCRDYFKLVGPHLLALVYRDEVDGTWHLERIYD